MSQGLCRQRPLPFPRYEDVHNVELPFERASGLLRFIDPKVWALRGESENPHWPFRFIAAGHSQECENDRNYHGNSRATCADYPVRGCFIWR
jgi:hypothetical protein